MTREEAIELVKSAFDVWEDKYSVGNDMNREHKARDMAIKALEQQPCEDCISREKAKQFLYERLDRLNDDELYDIFSRVIDDMYNELSPVTLQPKIGQWIEVVEKIKSLEKTWHYKCSICGNEESGWGEYKYCPSCGSRMEVQE